MPKRVAPLVAASLALAALASACGQAREADAPAAGSPPVSGQMSKQEFIERADAICERMNAEGMTIARRLKGRPPEELGKRAIELQARAITELTALPMPPGDEREIGAVLSHLRRLQAAMRFLFNAKGEEALPAVAGIAVEMDAVARTAKRYGMFRRCGAYHENPEVRRILRGQEPPALKGPDGKPPRPRPQRPFVPEIRRLASRLVPPGRVVLSRQDCAGGDPGAPSCVVIELSTNGSGVSERRAEIARLAAHAGWKQLRLTVDRPNPTSDRPHSRVLAFHRDGYDATAWLAGPDCAPQLQVGDGPNPTASTRRCVDTIMVIVSP